MNLRPFLTAGIAAVAVSVLIVPGPARAADQALLRALAHCGTVNDAAKRLDCYDSLAPRVKADLNAPAASPAPAPQVAARRPPTEQEEKSWFGFDMGELFGTAPDKQTTPQQFGADKLAAAQQARAEPAAPKPVDSITAELTDYAYTGYGKFVVFLANGQVWKQLQGDSDRARFRSKASDNTVTISRGLFGSYNLTMNGGNKSFKVTRIK